MSFRALLLSIALGAALAALGGCQPQAAASMPAGIDPEDEAVIAMARGEVDVPGGVMQIVAPSQGRLIAVAATEGRHVEAGEIMAKLDSESSALALATAQAALDGARAQEQLMRSRQRFAASQLERVRQASNDRATSQQTLDEAREAVAASDAELAHSASLRAAAQTTVRAAELALEMRTIRAPVAGRIVSLSEAGRALGFVQEGSQVFLLLPDAPLIVRARIEEEFASRIKVGMPAEVFTDSSPQRRFSARVTRLGGILRRQDSDTAPGDRQDVRAMDCVLSLDTTEVLVGQRVLVRFPAAATGALR